MPRRLGIPGEQYITASDQFLELETLPQRIVFIGADTSPSNSLMLPHGRAPKPPILHRGQRPLEGFDPDLVHQLVARTERLGVRVEIGMEVVAVGETLPLTDYGRVARYTGPIIVLSFSGVDLPISGLHPALDRETVPIWSIGIPPSVELGEKHAGDRIRRHRTAYPQVPPKVEYRLTKWDSLSVQRWMQS